KSKTSRRRCLWEILSQSRCASPLYISSPIEAKSLPRRSRQGHNLLEGRVNLPESLRLRLPDAIAVMPLENLQVPAVTEFQASVTGTSIGRAVHRGEGAPQTILWPILKVSVERVRPLGT